MKKPVKKTKTKTSNARSGSSSSVKSSRTKSTDSSRNRSSKRKTKNYREEETDGKPRFIDDTVVGKRYPRYTETKDKDRKKSSPHHDDENENWVSTEIEEVEEFHDDDENDGDEIIW